MTFDKFIDEVDKVDTNKLVYQFENYEILNNRFTLEDSKMFTDEEIDILCYFLHTSFVAEHYIPKHEKGKYYLMALREFVDDIKELGKKENKTK